MLQSITLMAMLYNNMNNTAKSLVVLALSVLFYSCTSTTSPTTPTTVEKILINSSLVNGLTVEVYADKPLTTGYNQIYTRVVKNGVGITDAHVSYATDMDMGMMHHSCPIDQPSEDVMSGTELFVGAVYFTMPSDSSWTMDVQVHDHASGKTVKSSFIPKISASMNVKMIAKGAEKFVLTMNPAAWKVGMNSLYLRLHRTTDGFDFTPVLDAWLKATPTMPSMGHGSPGNVDPTINANGWYIGGLNYTMSGDWLITVDGISAEAIQFTTSFNVTVP